MNAKQRPLVSIITPSYNAERFIVYTIASVQAQTFNNWEMLIVDDCSQDGTCKLVEQIASADGRIRLIRLEINSGPPTARNIALRAAKGRYVAFLDSDDLWLPQKLEYQLAFMQEKNAAFSYTQYRHMSESGDCIGSIIAIPDYFSYHDLLKNTRIGCLTVMIDREKTGPVQMANMHDEDFVLWLHLLKRGFVAYGLQRDLARYRVIRMSMSSKKMRAATWVWNVYRNVEKLNVFYAAWCFLHYSWNALLKRKSLTFLSKAM